MTPIVPFLALLAASSCSTEAPAPIQDTRVADSGALDASEPDAHVPDGDVTDVAESDASDAQGLNVGADDVTPDSAPPDVVLPLIPDGLLGSRCTTHADCNISGDPSRDFCRYGFCTTHCYWPNGLKREGICSENLSLVSEHGDLFECAADNIACMPGPVAGKHLFCQNNADCADAGPQFHCAARSRNDYASHGWCLPTADRAPTGAACSDNYDCASQLCLPQGFGLGLCIDHCDATPDCSDDSSLCIAYPIPKTAQPTDDWFGACLPLNSSRTSCEDGAVCPSGEVCSVFLHPTVPGPVYWCTPEKANGAELGSPCTSSSQCRSIKCAAPEGGDSKVCTSTCPAGETDCPDGFECATLPLSTLGTDNPADDVTYQGCMPVAAP